MDIPAKLKEAIGAENCKLIAEEFEKQVQLRVDAALHSYDDEAIKKVKLLEQQINEAHGRQLSDLMKKAAAKHKQALTALSERYDAELTGAAETFKNKLAKNIDMLIENNINSIVDFGVIKEAAKNSASSILLSNLRKQLAVDTALMKECVSKPLNSLKRDYAKAIDYIKKAKKENQMLSESLHRSEANLLVESKSSTLRPEERDYMKRIMDGKDIKFIKENFTQALDYYRQSKSKRHSVLTESTIRNHEAKQNRIVEPKKTRDLISESSEQFSRENDRMVQACLDGLVD